MIDLSTLAPTIRHQVNWAEVPMKTVGKEFLDLEDSKAKEVAMAWCDTVLSGTVIKSPGSPSSGLGLLLVGEPGHGKTTLAATALQSLIRTMPQDDRAVLPGMFMDYPKFLRLEKESWTDEVAKRKIDMIYGDSRDYVSIFVLDDLGKEYRTQAGWSENVFDALLRARFNAGLPTILTTNVPISKWKTTYGESMESFAHEAFVIVEVNSGIGDRRK